MSGSQWGVVTDALVAAYAATGVVDVFDGPDVTTEAMTEFLAVGWDGDDFALGDDTVPATVEQDWAGIGAHRRTETAEITCVVVVQSGDTVLKTLRDRALVIFGVLEAAFRADPSLGVLAPPSAAQMSSYIPHQSQTTEGAVVRLVFTVAYKARI